MSTSMLEASKSRTASAAFPKPNVRLPIRGRPGPYLAATANVSSQNTRNAPGSSTLPTGTTKA
jgi:hypothetical protein